MNVGDGTWDSNRNTFLLPNLVGFNFETMQYNGMCTPHLHIELRQECKYSDENVNTDERQQEWAIDLLASANIIPL